MFEDFKNHKVKAKSIFYISEIPKNTAYLFIKKYHYLGDAKFFAVQSFGLYCKETNQLLGVASFSLLQGTKPLLGWFGFNNQEKSIYELSRLAVIPQLNGTNATSFLLSNSIKILKKQGKVRAIITLADSSRHVGSIYQVCNFKYYGLTDKKSDFYTDDGRINPRGKVQNIRGVWILRTRKHRYCYLIDKSLVVKYKECPKPKADEVFKIECCNGTKKIYDKRFGVWYTCPFCTGALKLIEEDLKC